METLRPATALWRVRELMFTGYRAMKTSKLRRKLGRTSGFTLIETFVAIFVLVVGLMSVAALMSKMTVGTSQSRYAGISAVLASEKLEDLSRYSPDDVHVCIPAGGGTVGSLAADLTNVAAPCGGGATVDYADTVQLSGGQNTIVESYGSVDAGGGNQYSIVTTKPDGSAPVMSTSATPPNFNPDTLLVFNRRWVIEKDQPVVGVRRVTVLVTMRSPVAQPGPFQMSMVRP